VKDIMSLWHKKMAQDSIIIIEGGSEERDNIEWMKKYEMPSIKNEIETNQIIGEFYEHYTHEDFPSMTVLNRVR